MRYEQRPLQEKSIERVSSPEQLNDYVKVSSPGVWAVLAAVLILLAGAFVWGILGRLETTVPAVVISRDGAAVCCYDTAYGAEVVLTPGAEGMAGAVARADEICAANPGSIVAGQFSNPANPRAHYETTGPEIWRDTDGDVAAFVAGVGTDSDRQRLVLHYRTGRHQGSRNG